MNSYSQDMKLIEFYRWVPDSPEPVRADRSAGGMIPTRAYRYCEALCAASALGYYLFPPMDINVVWDGTRLLWAYEGAEDYQPVEREDAPGFPEYFDSHCPEDLRGYQPSIVSSGVIPGMVQFWSGWIARTAPGYGLLIRGMANIPVRSHYFSYEGIIETDRWFGPLFTNLQITRTDTPIEFRTDYPIIQVIPLKRETYYNKQFENYTIIDSLDSMSDKDWEGYRTTLVNPNKDPDRRFGRYAAETRKAKHTSLTS